MADNIRFLKGLSSALPSSSISGAFYLTTDDCRLYYGTGSGAPVLLNEQINIVSAVENLPPITEGKLPSGKTAKGVIYYATLENILCIYTGSKWQQINPDTDSDTSIKSFTISDARRNPDDVNDENWYYDVVIKEKNIEGNELKTPFQAVIKITPEMIADLSVDIGVAVGSTAIEKNSTTISTSGTGSSNSSSVKISGGDNVTLSGNENNIEISAKDTTYSLNTSLDSANEKVTVNLRDDVEGKNVDHFDIKAGDKLNINLSSDVITVAHETSGVTAGKVGASGVQGANGSTIVIPEYTVDTYGHITATSTKTINTKDTTYTASSINADDSGNLSFAIQDHEGDDSSATANGVLYHKITVDGTEKTVYNQNSLGSFYSKEQIDSKLAKLDAFVYKGTVERETGDKGLPTTNVSVGDTYKAAASFTTSGGETVHIGDIIIAHGTEDASTGYINSTIEWDIIHTEADTDTTYKLSTDGDKILLHNDVSGKNDEIIVQDDDIVVLTARGNNLSASHVKKGPNTNNVTTVGPSTDVSPDYSGTVAIPQITIDQYGHVTAAQDRTFTLPAEHEYDLEADANKNTLYLREDEAHKGQLVFAEDNWIDAALTVVTDATNGNGGKLTISHKDVTRTDIIDSNNRDDLVNYGGTFTTVSAVSSDAKGHITGITTRNVQLPSQLTYALSGATLGTVSKGVSITSTLTNSESKKTTSAFSLISSNDNLTITGSGTTVTVGLTWGTF